MNIFFLPLAFLAEIVGTIAGFGSSTIALPLALLFFDFRTALVLVAFLHLFGNVGRIWFFRHGVDRRMLIRFGIPSVAATLLGALLVKFLPQEVLKGTLGTFLTVYAAISWRKEFAVRASAGASIVGGGVSGFLAGLIGTGGALRAAFLTSFGLPKEKYIATAAAIALAVDAARIPVYVRESFLGAEFYWFIPVLLVIALAGSFIGRQIVRAFPQETFRKAVLAAIFLAGAKFVFDWIF